MARFTFPLLLLFIVTSSVAAISPSEQGRPNRIPDSRIGIVEAYQAPEISRQLGVAWQRVRFHWGEIQPGGPFEWIEEEVTIQQVVNEVASGREVVGLLIGLPAWAMDDQQLPKGLYLAVDDPDNLWANFVRQAVLRYDGLIDHWIIWNEPDIWDAEHPGFTWPGDERDFAQLLRIAYLVTKERNPEAVIHLPGLSHYWDANFGKTPYLFRLVEAIEELDPAAEEYNHYFDAVTYHLYFNPVANYNLLKQYISWLRTNDFDQPLWLIETNAAPSLDPDYPVANPQFRITLEEQSAYIPQMFALGLAAGVDHIAVYTLLDPQNGSDPEPFGLVRIDGTLRPAATALAVATRIFSGAISVTAQAGGAWWWVEIEHPDRTTHVLWSGSAAPIEVEIPSQVGFAQRVSMLGQARWVTAREGQYKVTLPGALCSNDPCIIGGEPIYLIEFN